MGIDGKTVYWGTAGVARTSLVFGAVANPAGSATLEKW